MEPIINNEIYKFSELQLKFFKRIRLEPFIVKTIDDISKIQQHCSKVFSFENLDIVTNQMVIPLTRDDIIDQLLCRSQGGLCYKINFVVCQFLLEFGFNVHLTRGSTRNLEIQGQWNIPTAHMICILNFKDNQQYLIDCAYGTNISLCPIPIRDNGDLIVENEKTGMFRIRRVAYTAVDDFKRAPIVTTFPINYTHILEFRKFDNFIIESSRIWTMGYAFDPLVKCGENDTTIVQSLIANDPNKEFSIKPLASKLIDNGLATLTYNSYTFTTFTGEKEKTTIDSFDQFNNYLNNIFNLPILKKPLAI